MAGSHAMERKKAAAARAKAGVKLDVSGKPKKEEKEKAQCTICKTEFKVTKRNVEMKSHGESKHPKSTV